MQKGLLLDEKITASELTSWLTSGGFSDANVCIIIDSCYSGSWIDDGEEPGGILGPGRALNGSSRSNQRSWGWGISAWTWFTGKERTRYVEDGPWRPLGVIGGFFAANDTNGDGWISFFEDFEFAKLSTEEYSSLRDHEQNPVAYNGLGFDPPLVRLPEHDVAIKTIQPYRTVISNDTMTEINVTVENKGDTQETFNLTLYYDSNEIETKTITLDSKETRTITFEWNTSGIELGNYTITAEASRVFGETETEDNTMTYGLITVSIPGDVNADGKVNIVDIFQAARAFGKKPGDSGWDPNTDLDENKTINILDLSAIAREFGRTIG